MMIEQLSSSNEKIRCLIRPEDIKRERERERERKKEKALMTWTGRWSLQGDVLAGDQSHQLAGKHRDAEMLGLPLKHGNCVRLALPPAGMESSMYLHTHCLSLDVLISQRFLVTAFLRIIFDDWR